MCYIFIIILFYYYINASFLSFSVFQSYRILPELLQRFHVTDRYGLQCLLPSLLWPAGKLAHVQSCSHIKTRVHSFTHACICILTYIFRHAVKHTQYAHSHVGRPSFFMQCDLQHPAKSYFYIFMMNNFKFDRFRKKSFKIPHFHGMINDAYTYADTD